MFFFLSYLDKFLVFERDLSGLDVPAVDVLVQEDDGGVGAAVQELDVADKGLLHPDVVGPELGAVLVQRDHFE